MATKELTRVGVVDPSAVPRPARIPDTFLLIPRAGRGFIKSSDPVVTISRSEKYGKTGCRLLLGTPIKRDFGLESTHKRTYVQVFTSATTLKISKCDQGDEDARMIAGDGYITCREIGEWFRLEEGMSFRCNAEVVKGAKLEIWATFPPELRDRIGEINGVIR